MKAQGSIHERAGLICRYSSSYKECASFPEGSSRNFCENCKTVTYRREISEGEGLSAWKSIYFTF
jgi:hypothetical protein